MQGDRAKANNTDSPRTPRKNLTIAFFDFDGTITNKDSFMLFLRHILGTRFYPKLFVNLPTMLLYKLGILDNHIAKERVLKSCIKNLSKTKIEQSGVELLESLAKICKISALDKIKWHKENNHEVVVVSASFSEYLAPLCENLGVKLIASKLEFVNGVATGQILGKNCFGSQKVAEIKKIYNLADFSSIYAYGDSKGDLEMLRLASPNQAFYRNFA